MSPSPARMRRPVLRAVAAAAVSALIVSLGAASAPAQQKPDPNYPTPAGSIEFWHWRAEDKPWLDDLIKKFQNQHPGTTITQVILPSGEYQATAFQKIRNNPKAAVFTAFRGPQFTTMATSGLMLPLTGQPFLANVYPEALRVATLGNTVYGVPYHNLFNMPIYNTEIFAKEGIKPPTTWDGWLQMCRTLKAKGYIPIAFPGATRGQAGQIMNTMFMNEMPTDNYFGRLGTGTASVSDPWFLGVAQKYEQMAQAGCFQDNASGTPEAAANALFAQGRAAIMPTGSFSMGAIKVLNPAMSGKMQLMAPITRANPKYEGIRNNTFIFGVNDLASDPDQQIALSFINFMLKPGNAQTYALGTSQHVTVKGVKYDANVDLKNTGVWLDRKTLLAPRFQILNQQVVDNVADLLTAIAGGRSANDAVADFGARIKAILG